MKAFKLAVGILPAVILAACGGHPNDAGSSGTTTVSGSALKGTVRNGKVEIFQLADDGSLTDFSKASPIQTGETDDNGNFTMPVSDAAIGGKALAIRITPKDNKHSSKLRCDARPNCGSQFVDGVKKSVKFKDFYDVPDGFKMLTLIPAPKGTANVSVNPLTTVAANRADERLKAGDKSAASAIKNANSEVSQLCGGIDISTVKPVDSADDAALKSASPDQQASSLLIAGLLAKGGGDPNAAIDQFSYVDGAIKAGDLQAIVEQARSQLQQANAENPDLQLPTTFNSYSSIEQQAAKPDADGNVKQTPDSSADLSPSDKGKKLVQDVRNFSQSVLDLQNPERTFLSQVDQGTKGYDPTANGIGQALGKTVTDMAACAESAASHNQTVDCSKTGNSPTTVKSTIANGIITTTGQEAAGGVTSNLTFTRPISDISQDTAKTITGSLTGTVAGGATGKKLKLTISQGQATLTKKEAKPLDPQRNATDSQIISAIDNLVGDLTAKLEETDASNPVVWDGALGLTLVSCTKCGINVDSNDPNVAKGKLGANLTRFVLSGTVSQGGQSNSATFTVAQDDSSARNFDNGKPLSSTNFIKATAQLQTKITLSGKDTNATLSVSTTGYTDKPHDHPLGTVDLTLVTAGKTLKLGVVETANSDPNSVLVTISSPNGTSAVLTVPTSTTSKTVGTIGSITADNTKVADIERRSNGLILVKYPDGTFETLAN